MLLFMRQQASFSLRAIVLLLYSTLLFQNDLCGNALPPVKLELTNFLALPPVNLGLTNILDGGPIRGVCGMVFFYNIYNITAPRHSSLCAGNLLGGIPSPDFKGSTAASELAYQSDQEILLKGKWGAA